MKTIIFTFLISTIILIAWGWNKSIENKKELKHQQEVAAWWKDYRGDYNLKLETQVKTILLQQSIMMQQNQITEAYIQRNTNAK